MQGKDSEISLCRLVYRMPMAIAQAGPPIEAIYPSGPSKHTNPAASQTVGQNANAPVLYKQ